MMTPLSSSLSSSPQSSLISFSPPPLRPGNAAAAPKTQRHTRRLRHLSPPPTPCRRLAAAPPAPQHARCPPPTPTMPPCGRCSAAAPTTPRHAHRCRDRRPLSPPPPIHKHPDNAATHCRRHPPSPTTMHTRRKRPVPWASRRRRQCPTPTPNVNAHADANADEEAAQWEAARDGRQRRSQWTAAARSRWTAAMRLDSGG